MAGNDECPHGRPQWLIAAGTSLLVAGMQLAAGTAVYLAIVVLALTAESGPDDQWAAIAYLIYGLLAIPAVATVAGPIVAAVNRLRFPLLYVFPAPLSVGIGYGIWAATGWALVPIAIAVAALFGGNALIGIATGRPFAARP